MSGRSCVTNLLVFLDSLTNYIDNGWPVDVVYLDFAKAFDKVPHHRLLMKLASHGITGKVAGWIKAWLSNRTQRVVLNGKKSQCKPVRSGVPHGSVLGPLLFLIFINDIDSGVSNTILKFADDTKLLAPVNSPNNALSLQEDLNQLFNWSQEWQMLFNVEKCKTIHFGYNNPEYPYSMDGKNLSSVDHEKDLGVIIHSSLKPAVHIAEKVKKANRFLGMINRTFKHRSKQMMLQLYKSMVRPHLDYASAAWSPHQKNHIDLLEKVQRRFTRMVPGLSPLPYEERLKKLKLTTLQTRRTRADLLEVFKMFSGDTKVKPEVLFERSESSTRGHRHKLFKQRCSLV